MQDVHLGRVAYLPTYQAMQAFTAARGPDTPDELWLCEHEPVFTQGLAGKPEHLLRDIGIPRPALAELAAISFDDWFVQSNPRPIAHAGVIEAVLDEAW